jgi:hypothetical protein
MITIAQTFEKNIESVEKLINFDREFMDIAIGSIQDLHDRLVDRPYSIDNEQSNGKRTLDILKQIRNNDALKPKFSTINNQAVVLLVSYFGSATADLFRAASRIAVEVRHDTRVLNSELKVKVEELVGFESSLSDSIGDVLITKNSISFQDMKSIQREFKKYFGILIERDENVNNIILGQACRHSIAHEAGIINSRVIHQVQGAKPRALKPSLTEGSNVEFTEEEILIVAKSMLAYVVGLERNVNDYRANI